MASYIQGLTDTLPSITPFQPDFGMVQKALSTLQSRYEQGFASVKNAYNQVLNAPISNAENRAAREQFVKEADKQLQSLASVDLSRDENRIAAENVFAPFWQDDEILFDAAETKRQQGEWDRMMSFANSKDDKVREQFNPIMMEYLSGSQEQLKNAHRGDGSMLNVDRRYFTPWKDTQKYLDEAAEKEKLEIKWTEACDGYLVETVNGKRSERNFQVWARSKMGPQFEHQFRIESTVGKERAYKGIRQRFGDLPEEQVRGAIADEMVSEYINNAKSQKNMITGNISKTDTSIRELKEWAKTNNLTQAQVIRLNQLENELEALNKMNAETDQNITAYQQPNSGQVLAIREKLMSNPDTYFYNMIRDRTLNNWGVGRAEKESRTIKRDETWDRIYQEAHADYRTQLAQQTEMMKANMKDIDGDGKIEGKYEMIRDAYGNTVGYQLKSPTSSQQEDKGHYQGPLTSQIEQRKDVDIFNTVQQQKYQTGYESKLSGIEDILIATQGIPGIANYTETRDYLEKMRAWMRDPTKAPAGGTFDKVWDYLKEKGYIPKSNEGIGPWAALLGLERYATDEIDRMAKDHTLTPELAVKVTDALNAGEDAKQEYDRNQNAMQAMMKSLLINDKKGEYKKIVDDHYNILNEEQFISKNHENNLTVTALDGSPVNLKTSDVVRLRESGAIKDVNIKTDRHVAGHDAWNETTMTFTMGGKRYALNNANTDHGASDGSFIYAYAGGYGKELKGIHEKLKVNSTPQMEEFRSQTGRFGHVINFPNISDKLETSDLLAGEILNPTNNTGLPINLSGDKDKIAGMINWLSSNYRNVVGGVDYHTLTSNGKRSILLKLDASKITKEMREKTPSPDTLDEMVANGVEFELSNVASGEAINKLPKPTEFLSYAKIYRGETVTANPLLKKLGYDYSITRNSTGTEAIVTLTQTVRDPKTGELTQLPPRTKTIPLTGDYAKLPQEIVGLLRLGFLQQLQSDKKVLDDFKKNASNTTISLEEYEKRRQAARASQ